MGCKVGGHSEHENDKASSIENVRRSHFINAGLSTWVPNRIVQTQEHFEAKRKPECGDSCWASADEKEQAYEGCDGPDGSPDVELANRRGAWVMIQ